MGKLRSRREVDGLPPLTQGGNTTIIR